MQTLKRLTLTVIVGIGIGSTQAQAENTDATDRATQLKAEQVQALSQPDQEDLLMQALRKKQAELGAPAVSSKPATAEKQNAELPKAAAKKQKADREAKIAAERKIQSDEITAQKLKAKEEAKKKLQSQQAIAPVKTTPVSESTESDAVLIALRKKQAELAAQETAKTAPVVTPVAAHAVATPVAAPVVTPVAAPVVAPVVAAAPATEAQMNEAMAALRKKQAELAAQEKIAKTAPVVTPVTAPVVTPVAAPVVAAPVVAAPVVAAPVVAAPVVAAPASEAQMNEAMSALRKKQAELAIQEAATKPISGEKTLSKAEKQKQKEKAAMDRAIADKQKREARAALEAKKASQQIAVKPKAVVEAPKQTAPEAVLVNAKKVVPTAEPSAVANKKEAVVQQPLSKEQKLADLLRRYKADQITPREYHTERAKVIAEP